MTKWKSFIETLPPPAPVPCEEVPGKPGVYRAIAFLRPHFQLDELTVSLRLVAELLQPVK